MNGADTEKDPMVIIVSDALSKLLLVPSEKPDRILNSTDGRSKWRRGWFTSVIGYIDMLGMNFFEKDQELQKRISDSRSSWSVGEMSQRRLTEQSDIDQADQLIKDVLEYLKK